MRIVFFGTPEFASSILKYLLDASISVLAVVTQPDRSKGRSLQKVASPVKKCIEKRGVEILILQPHKASDPLLIEQLKKLEADLFVVVAFGQILPQFLLDIPPKGCINIHASLLPKYRGAAPIQRCIMAGEKETGIAIQKMVKELDAGDVIASAKIEISPNMTFGELENELCELSKPLLLFVLRAYEEGVPSAEPQNHSLATYAFKIEGEEGEIQWEKEAQQIHDLVRAFSPRPGAWSKVHLPNGGSKRVKILRTEVIKKSGEPGRFISSEEAVVACGANSLKIVELCPEGQKRMSGAEWLRGFRGLPFF